MRVFCAVPLLALAACPAPDAIDIGPEPSIELLHPPPGEALVRAADGSMDFLVVVDIDGFDFNVDEKGNPPVVGQGHYHVWIESDHVGSPEELSHTLLHSTEEPLPNLATASEVHIRVSLQNNDHSDYNDPDNDGVDLEFWQSIVAYDIVDEGT